MVTVSAPKRSADRAASMGLGDIGRGNAMGIAWGDYDNDGFVDLYVTNLGNNRLYRNDGDGRFSDVSRATGITVSDPVTDAPLGKALGVAILDYDADGWLDILVANDTVRNYLYHNLGDGRFEEVGAL